MSCTFTMAHYRDLLHAALGAGYRIATFDHEPEPGDLFLRHDVDMSLEAAVTMAEVDAEEGIRSTFFLMTRSNFYNLASPVGERTIARLRELGHRVGHHARYPHIEVDERFDPFVAWHNPEPSFMHIEVPGAVNVMRAPFFDHTHYRSDSNQDWRNGCPHDAIAEGRYDWLHLLIHPVIWVFPGETMRETMEAFLDADRAVRLDLLAHDRIDLS